MTTLSSHTSRPFVTSGRPIRFGYLAALVGTVMEEWRAHQAARHVGSLSDEMLHDIGVSRSEIDLAVRYGRR